MNSSAVFNITHHIKYVNLPEKFARFLISQKKTIPKKKPIQHLRQIFYVFMTLIKIDWYHFKCNMQVVY